MLKAWVTGSSGFIGTPLVKSLGQHNFRVTCVTNAKTHQNGALYVDYASRESIRSVLEVTGVPDLLFHLGWGNIYEPQLPIHLGQNLENTETLFDELYKNGLNKIILVGSSSEYGGREGCLSEGDPPTGRLTNYAKGKIEACHYGLEAARKHKKTFIHVRLFHTFGVSERQSSLINQLYKSYRASTVLGLTECDQFRDYLHLSEAVEGIIRISASNSSGIINLGSGNKIQLKEFIKLFWEKLGGSGDLLMFGMHKRPEHEPLQPPCYADLAKLREWTNWQPTLSIEEGILKTINELKGSS